jgi:hypothetical protein
MLEDKTAVIAGSTSGVGLPVDGGRTSVFRFRNSRMRARACPAARSTASPFTDRERLSLALSIFFQPYQRADQQHQGAPSSSRRCAPKN